MPPTPASLLGSSLTKTKELNFLGRPRILHMVDNLALISIPFAWGHMTDYYLYRAAGRGRRPSLELLGYISDYLKKVPFVAAVGILPRGGNDRDGDFVLAALDFAPVAGQCGLHVFRSQRGIWSCDVHVLERHGLSYIEKVITLEGGELGFVDLCKGILACNVLQEKFTSRIIPLPKLLPNNQSDNELYSARLFRDVIFSADSLICVELEACWRHTVRERPDTRREKPPEDVSHKDVLYDSDLMPHQTMDTEEEEEETNQYCGWRVIAWSKKVSSTSWHKECLVHVDDIVNNTIHTELLEELGE